MKQFQIVLYKGNSLINRIIRKITKSQSYSHCAFMLDNYHCLELSWRDSCVVKHFKYQHNDYDLYELDFELNDEQIEDLHNYIFQYLNSGYDFKFLMTRGLNLLFGTPIKNSKHKMTCDEIIYESFLSIGINLLDDELDVLTPELLSKSKLLKRVK